MSELVHEGAKVEQRYKKTTKGSIAQRLPSSSTYLIVRSLQNTAIWSLVPLFPFSNFPVRFRVPRAACSL